MLTGTRKLTAVIAALVALCVICALSAYAGLADNVAMIALGLCASVGGLGSLTGDGTPNPNRYLDLQDVRTTPDTLERAGFIPKMEPRPAVKVTDP